MHTQARICHHCIQALARRLDEALLSGVADDVALSVALADGPRSPTPGERHAAPPAVAAAVGAASEAAGPAPEQERGRSASQPAELTSAASGSGGTDLSFSLWRSSSQPTAQPGAAAPGRAGGDQQPSAAAAAAAAQQAGPPADGATVGWQVLLVPLAAVARVDVRPRVADAAAAVLLQVLKLHGEGLTPQQWLHLYQTVLQPLLALPTDAATAAAAAARLDGAHLPLASPATPTAAAAATGSPASAGDGVAGAPGGFAEAVRRTTTGGGALEGLPAAVPAMLSLEGLDR